MFYQSIMRMNKHYLLGNDFVVKGLKIIDNVKVHSYKSRKCQSEFLYQILNSFSV